ncbi:MAG: hypothetical protein Q3986_08025 [Akkermansia sp.]|nr:hypothetical protein [Akkermansia sp.]
MSNTPDTPLPILGTRVQNTFLRDFHAVMSFVIGAAHEHVFASLDLGDTISWAYQTISDFLCDQFTPTDKETDSLADFLAMVYNHLEHPESSRSKDVTETTLAPGYFCTRHHALMRRHISAYAAIASEALTLYDHDEADEEDIVPLIVDRFITHLKGQGEPISPNFRRALTDFALLGTILHITRETLAV